MQRATTSKLAHESSPPESGDSQSPTAWNRKSAIVLILLLAGFLTIEFLLPLRTAIQIGGDEGFELAKADLSVRGYKLYTDAWNNQPPLHTFLVAQTLRHISPSILGPRLITVGFALLLLASVFIMVQRISGLTTAALTTAFLIASPGFIGLSASCMLEIPALAPSMAALCLLVVRPDKWGQVLSGVLFGIAFQIKLINIILLPFVVLILWFHHRKSGTPIRTTIGSLFILGLSLVISYVAVDCLVDGGAYLRNFRQSWVSNFAAGTSFEYGSASDHPFDWRILFRNWDATVPTTLGVLFSITSIRREPGMIFPLLLLALELAVFSIHKPWWPYYYVHIAIPLSWCAAIGFEGMRRRINPKRKALFLLTAVLALCVLAWMGLRIDLQVRDIRNSAQTYSSLVFNEIKRYKPFTEWMYADKVIYTFHARILPPPTLAVIPLKRLWTGEMTNERIAVEMRKFKPGLVLLANDTRMPPFKELLDSEYRLVYEDADLRLYALRTLIRQARH